MANTVIALKKSPTPSAVPSNLSNGELAINYSDGKLFYKHANGTILSISSSGAASFGTINANNTLVVAESPGAIVSLIAGQNITIVGDAINDTVTISANVAGVDPSFAYGQANTARDGANTVGGYANSAYGAANLAWTQANTAQTTGVAAFGQANTAQSTAVAAFGKANSASTDAGAAFGQANTATTNAGNAFGAANTAQSTGVAAFAKANTSIQNNATTLITVGYTITPFNAGANVASYGTWQPNATNGNYQYATSNGAVTITTPPADCAMDILFTNGVNAKTITFSGYNVSATPGVAYATTYGNKYILSIRRINATGTYSWYPLQ
jgi:hypothetical protein